MDTALLNRLLQDRRVNEALPEPELRRLLRRRSHLTQRDVARLVGVDRATVARWERGTRTPRGEHLDSYLAVLDELAAST